MRRVAVLLLALVLAGCGGGSSGGDARETLRETAANLGEIRSGDLTLRVVVGSEDAEAGFELDGPFAFAGSADALPVAELEYTQIAGAETAAVTLISTGERAFVETASGTFEIPEEQAAELRGAGAGDAGGGADLGTLNVGRWFQDAELEDGGEVGGAETDRIRSQLDVVAAANSLLEVAASFGASGLSTLEGASADQLRRAVESATVEVFTGKEDRLLRRLVIDARFRAAPPAELEEAFANLPGAEFRLELTLANPNREITVEEPANAEPLP